ncbi:hypothetical protein [Proteus mirabilis]|uniref:hypothetical protein n=1 Tax=Proteus mirabilis TaxID=584 RepID=UPI0018C806BF|nr:hypothetical protein [Proteus mirabilis]MBG2976446.1 hypothetical protein [Proteus mirabilis]MBG3095148.1 hypothetical protein [Proteus mirabilis]MBI6208358.1 hypothetical protein [Proteus mirabilis]MDC6033420.1 hypothetical protein [Proteus mirabilis]MDC6045360.1 hypothetical protein [Proteus mirabilis]
MLDIVSDLNEKKSELISLHEVIVSLREQSPEATLPQIAEWLLIHLANDPESPDMGFLPVGGEFERISEWRNNPNEHYSLKELLLELYRNYGVWPGEIPF